MDGALVFLTAVLAVSTLAYTAATFVMASETPQAREEAHTARESAISPILVLEMKRAGRAAVVPAVVNAGQGWLRRGSVTVTMQARDGSRDERHLLVPTLAPGADIELMPRGTPTPLLFEDVAAAIAGLQLEWSGTNAAGNATSGSDQFDVAGWAATIRGNQIRDAITEAELLIDGIKRVATELGPLDDLVAQIHRIAEAAERPAPMRARHRRA